MSTAVREARRSRTRALDRRLDALEKLGPHAWEAHLSEPWGQPLIPIGIHCRDPQTGRVVILWRWGAISWCNVHGRVS